MKIAPSMLAALEIDMPVEKALNEIRACDFVHLDMMDGRFVKKTVTFEKEMKKMENSKIPIDMHLMVNEPDILVKKYGDICEMISFHMEAPVYHLDIIDSIKASGSVAGIALNPETEIEKINPFLKKLDFVLVMSVAPGKCGQAFLPSSLEKVRGLKKSGIKIEIDGGINEKNFSDVLRSGAGIAVMGSAIFNKNPVKENIKKFSGV